ncbi:MAG: hypothetical protein NC399_00780 [Muribaculum sp.]|nr:hypothetical protein [Muribaculum sp.]
MTMRLRYYLRGLAVGIVLTTIIFAVVNAGNKPLTDAQIRQRALALGMIESDSVRLSSLQGGQEPAETESGSGENASGGEGMPEDQSGNASGGDGVGLSEESGESAPDGNGMSETQESGANAPDGGVRPDGSAGASTEPEETSVETGSSETEEPLQTITFRIQNGAGSSGVSRDLAAVGLVEDASAFDTFLCDNGYSKRLRAGTYEIVPGTSEEEIARIITGG